VTRICMFMQKRNASLTLIVSSLNLPYALLSFERTVFISNIPF